MLRVVIIRPGATDFDEQGRIQGTLDLPLNAQGAGQATRTAGELQNEDIEVVYTSPCQAAMQTAKTLSKAWNVKLKRLDVLSNLNQGLWHGKLISEVKEKQPKVYRLWQECPELVCPPEGETVAAARQRVLKTLKKLLKKHREGVIALVVPEPLASIICSFLKNRSLGDLWKSQCEVGSWEAVDLESSQQTVV